MSNKHNVGYGKPPKSGQFKKGHSGNPKGRPKGSRNMKTVLRDIWESKVAVTENGKTRKVPFVEVFMRKMVMKALNGSTRDQISLLKAFHDYTPELLQDLRVPDQLRVVFVDAKDGKPAFEIDEETGERRKRRDKPDPGDDSWLN